MMALWSCHLTAAAFHSDPQLDFAALRGMTPNEEIGRSPVDWTKIPPNRSRPSDPESPMSPSKSEMRMLNAPLPMKAFSGLSKNIGVVPITWCVRFFPSVPLRVAGSYELPIFDRYSSRTLFSVYDARTTV